MNTSFNSDLVVMLGSASNEFDNIVEVPKNKISSTNPENTQRKRGFNQTPNQVEDIETSTTNT